MPDQIDQQIENNEHYNEGGVVTSIKYIQRDIAAINEKLDKKFVTKEEFNPVKNIVYGMVGLILIAVIGAIVASVVTKSQPSADNNQLAPENQKK